VLRYGTRSLRSSPLRTAAHPEPPGLRGLEQTQPCASAQAGASSSHSTGRSKRVGSSSNDESGSISTRTMRRPPAPMLPRSSMTRARLISRPMRTPTIEPTLMGDGVAPGVQLLQPPRPHRIASPRPVPPTAPCAKSSSSSWPLRALCHAWRANDDIIVALPGDTDVTVPRPWLSSSPPPWALFLASSTPAAMNEPAWAGLRCPPRATRPGRESRR
jgi:hypothetical protein